MARPDDTKTTGPNQPAEKTPLEHWIEETTPKPHPVPSVVVDVIGGLQPPTTPPKR
jgi:hypothetical protein